MSDSFIIFNQLATNRRVGQIEAELREQRNLVDQSALQKSQLDLKRNVLFRAKREVERLQQDSGLSNVDRALSLQILSTYLQVNRVSPDSFDELLDKEYAAQTIDALERMKSNSLVQLSAAERNHVSAESQRRFQVKHLETIVALFELRKRLPRTPFYRRYSGRGAKFWIFVTLVLQPFLAIPYLASDAIDMEMVHQISNGLYMVTAVIAARAICHRWVKKSREEGLRSKAADLGLSFDFETAPQVISFELKEISRLLEFHGLKKLPRTAQQARKTLSGLNSMGEETSTKLSTIS